MPRWRNGRENMSRVQQRYPSDFGILRLGKRLSVALIEENLWRDVLGRSTERVGAILNHFGEPKIRELQVPVLCEQDILRLQISVNDVFGVAVLKNERDARRVKSSRLIVKPTGFSQVGEELPPNHVLEHQVQVPWIVKAAE